MNMQLSLANLHYEADLALGLSLPLHKSLSLTLQYNFHAVEFYSTPIKVDFLAPASAIYLDVLQ